MRLLAIFAVALLAPAAHTAMMMDKLGVGLHVVPVGKFYLFAGTIFYIPFTVGIGISW
jgi:hypothetical protein